MYICRHAISAYFINKTEFKTSISALSDAIVIL